MPTMVVLTMFRLRCDRNEPCQTCIRLGKASACSFPCSPTSYSSGNGSGHLTDPSRFQDRINHLEGLVRLLAARQQPSPLVSTTDSTAPFNTSTTTDEASTLAGDFGHMRLKNNLPSYVESDHWTAILEEINDLKDLVKDEAVHAYASAEEESLTLPGADLFFLTAYPNTKKELTAAFPSRPIADSMIAQYFKVADMPITLIIHRRVFFKQYETFWQDPMSTSTMWMTILFGMMYLGVYTATYINPSDSPIDGDTLLEYQRVVLTYL